jgi:HK97 family phage prohead protease
MNNLSRTVASLREIKLAGSDTDMTFSGYGAVFNNIDSYGDLIVPGAFADTLAAARKSGEWPVMLMQHGGMGLMAEDMMPIGIWTDMSEDGIGLKLTGKLADTVRGREAYTLMKMQPRPAITGLSIGYIAKEYSPRSKPEEPRRTLKKVDLFEVSLVTFPANPKARVSDVKSSHGLTVRDAEEALRDAGFSRTESKAILAKGYSSLGQREAGETDYADELRDLIATISR